MRSLSLVLALLAPAAAAAVELPTEFQGRWQAAGSCSAENDIPGGFVTVTADGITGKDLSCRLTGVLPFDDRQNTAFSATRTCGSGSGRDVRLYLVDSDVLGKVLVTVDANGSFLTLYRRCP